MGVVPNKGLAHVTSNSMSQQQPSFVVPVIRQVPARRQIDVAEDGVTGEKKRSRFERAVLATALCPCLWPCCPIVAAVWMLRNKKPEQPPVSTPKPENS